MTAHFFLDETKQRGYSLAVVSLAPTAVRPARAALRNLVLPGQRRLHMKSERDSRRRLIVSAMVELEVQAVVVDAGRRYGTDLERRDRCLRAVVAHAKNNEATTLVIESDETLIHHDRQLLYAETRAQGYERLRYEHRRPFEELLLALPDAVAWCWAKGGEWRRRVESVVSDVIEV